MYKPPKAIVSSGYNIYDGTWPRSQGTKILTNIQRAEEKAKYYIKCVHIRPTVKAF